LIVASSDAAMARAAIGVEASGYRVGAKLPIERALERIELQAAASALWIEVDRDCGGLMDDLLARVSGDVAEGRYAAVVSATGELVDPLAAQLECDAIELVVDGDEAERAAAL
jgi:hypothetical protein